MFNEPVKLLYTLVNAGLALLLAFPLGLSHHNLALVTTIITGVTSGVAALLTRPILVSGLTAAAATVLTAVAGFGQFGLTTEKVGALVALLSVILGLLLRTNVSPAPRVGWNVRAG